MCKSKTAIDAASPISLSRTRTRTQTRNSIPSSKSNFPSTSDNPSSSSTTYNFSTSTSSGGSTSLASLRESLPEKPVIYSISEIQAATNNFLAKRHSTSSSSTPSWQCKLRNKEVIIFQRKLNQTQTLSSDNLKQHLSLLSHIHHANITKLLGATNPQNEHVSLVYEFIKGANLSLCLRNPRNPDFTVLSNWVDRMRIATDLASAIDYIHNGTGLHLKLFHNDINSDDVIITEPDFSAKLSHFGTAQICGDEGDQGSDIYAFGLVLLELFSGEEPLKYRFDKMAGDFVRTSVVETAERALDCGGVRRWVDRRLKDSFPVEVAEKVMRLALDCVVGEVGERPDMGRVAGKMSRLYIESRDWAGKFKVPNDQISMSLGPR